MLSFARRRPIYAIMQKLSIFVCATVFSYLGWALGGLVGGIMTAFFVSGALSLVGVWVGWWLYRRFLI